MSNAGNEGRYPTLADLQAIFRQFREEDVARRQQEYERTREGKAPTLADLQAILRQNREEYAVERQQEYEKIKEGVLRGLDEKLDKYLGKGHFSRECRT